MHQAGDYDTRVQMHKADGSMVRALAPADPEVEDEQAIVAREVASATQTAVAPPQENPTTLSSTAALFPDFASFEVGSLIQAPSPRPAEQLRCSACLFRHSTT